MLWPSMSAITLAQRRTSMRLSPAFLSRAQTRRCRRGLTLSMLPRGVPRLGVGVGAALETPRVGAKGRACHCVTAGPIRLKVHKSLQIRQTQALCRGPSHARTRIAGCQHRSANGGLKLGVARVVPSGRVARRALFHCHAIRPTLMGGLLLIE